MDACQHGCDVDRCGHVRIGDESDVNFRKEPFKDFGHFQPPHIVHVAPFPQPVQPQFVVAVMDQVKPRLGAVDNSLQAGQRKPHVPRKGGQLAQSHSEKGPGGRPGLWTHADFGFDFCQHSARDEKASCSRGGGREKTPAIHERHAHHVAPTMRPFGVSS